MRLGSMEKLVSPYAALKAHVVFNVRRGLCSLDALGFLRRRRAPVFLHQLDKFYTS
jgi:hypothetical protein